MSDFRTLLPAKQIMSPNSVFEDEKISVIDAAMSMVINDTDSIMVTTGGKISGIITESDIVRKVVAQRKNPAEVQIGALKTESLISINGDESIFEVKNIMETNKVRHLLVEENGNFIGLIAARDLLK